MMMDSFSKSRKNGSVMKKVMIFLLVGAIQQVALAGGRENGRSEVGVQQGNAVADGIADADGQENAVADGIADTDQQGNTVSGRITDVNGDALIGVNVVLEGTAEGVISDADGNYSIVTPDGNARLVFSYIGYVSQTVVAGNRSVVHVVLTEDARVLDEVVVVGYGTQKKGNLTGAVSVVNMGKTLGDRPVTDVARALQGAVPGLQITGGATPGGSKTFNIRGTTSINGSPGPLILVDNVECQIDLINPEDIETVTVLKDAASSAIYGARAAFGVILVTTKKSRVNTKMSLNYSTNFAFEKATNRVEEAGVSDFVNTANEWSPNGSWVYNGQSFSLWREYIDAYRSNPGAFASSAAQNGEYFNAQWGIYTPQSGAGAGKYFYLRDNDSQNEIFDRSGFQQTHNVSASGGGEKITYRFSLGYLDNDGPLKTSKDEYQRTTVSSFVNAALTSWLGTSVDIRYAQGTQRTLESTFGSGIYQLRYFNFWPGADSWTAANDPDGAVYLNTSPLNYVLHGNPDVVRTENPRIFSRTILTPLQGVEGVFEYTYDENVYDKKSYPNSLSMRNDQMNSNPYADPAYRNDKSTVRYNSLNAYASYSLSPAGKNHFKLMGGFSQEQRYYELLWASRKEIINSDSPSISGATGEILAGDNYTDYAIRSGFFRFNYHYDDKYLLEVNGRYDGSSKFPSDTRFGFFPSFSVGWQVGREGFMDWSKSWLDEWKIRGAWGEIGNQAITDYQFLPEMTVALQSNWIYNGKRPTTLNPPGMVRSNFTWERVATLDLGTDLSLFNNRLQATFGWYQRDTRGMLGPGLEFPAIVGTSAPLQNVADLRTKGWEVAVSWRNKINDWGYSAGFNLSDYKSEITRYNNEAGLFRDRNSAETESNRRYYEGMQFGEIWGYQFDRFYTVDDFENTTSWQLKPGVATIKGVSPRPGDVLWKNISDQSGENEINNGNDNLDDPGDRSIIGNETPRFQFGANVGGSYKGFDLSVFAQGVGKRDYWLGGDIVFPLVGTNSSNENGTIYQHHVNNYAQVVDAANGDYTLVNPNAFYPRIYNQPGESVNNSNRRVSDRYLLNASYLRIKNITLSYTLPHTLVHSIGLSNARLFFSAEDVFTFDSLPKGVDPERMSWGYPFYATYSFGFNITL
jgi:TonB-linked SusC/RagA family outer membrane protein